LVSRPDGPWFIFIDGGLGDVEFEGLVLAEVHALGIEPAYEY
jgi:hypothetical protein